MADLGLPLPQVDTGQARGADLQARAGAARTKDQAREIANEFEKMFIAQMLQPMFADLPTDGPFGGGAAEEMFRPLLLEEYAGAVAKQGGVGVSDAVYREILRIQGLE
jgi:flagellar protein FlgJ